MVRRSLRQSAADTPLATWLVEYGESRGWTAGRQAAKYLGVKQAAFSTWLRGEVEPGRENQEQLAAATGQTLAFVAELVRRTKEQKEGASPTALAVGPGAGLDAVGALLRGIAEKVDAMYDAFDRGEIVGAWASPERPSLDAELATMTDVTPEDRSRLIPVPVADNREARELPLASVVWIDPGGEPHPGKVVLVQKAGVKRLKKYEPGDDVIGVGRLVQWTLP